MATADHAALTPPAPAPEVTDDASATKRKRDDSEPKAESKDIPQTGSLSQTQDDILEVIRKYDTEPSFLDYTFSDAHTNGPAQKKQRQSHSGDGQKTTIANKLRGSAYTSLSQLVADIEHVSKELTGEIRASEKEDGQNAGRLSVDDLKRIQRIAALEKFLKDVVDREDRRDNNTREMNGGSEQEASAHANGTKSSTFETTDGKHGTVLTLFGNAPHPRQLFSSMQQPAETKEPNIKVELPVEELGLPNGLLATQIMPSSAADAKKGPTFEESFPAPFSLPSIHPPKGHKRSAVRDTTLHWEFKEPSSRGSKRGGYTTQSLTTADWLGYGGVDPAYGLYTPQEKRKQRDRALSGGESMQTALTKAQAEAELLKQEEALFRRSFSSFAPTTDSSRSLVPAETMSMMYMSKHGDNKFHEIFADDAALTQEIRFPESAIDPALMETDAKEEDFSNVLEQLDSLQDEGYSEPEQDKTDPELVLRQISELLETLASHQRIRNAVIPPATSTSRTPISPAPTLASIIGKPDAPAEDEVNTYNKLRHEIAYLALKLPPYALAKLNGDQLADLGVSKLLPFEARDYQGALEEDSVTRAAKQAAAATAAATASLTRPTSSASGQHYSNSTRGPAIGAAANTRYGQSAVVPGRTPATAPAYNRQPSQSGSYGTPSAAPRPTYTQPGQYARPGAPQQGSYGQSTTQQQQYYGQSRPQPTTTYGSYGQNFGGQGTPQTQPRPNYTSSQPLQQFQRAPPAAQNATAYQTNAAQAQAQAQQSPYKRTASPAMPLYQNAQQHQQQQAQRPSYGNAGMQQQQQQQAQYAQQPGSGRATPSFPSQPPTPVNGMPRAPAPLVPRAASGTPQPLQPAQGGPNGHS